MIESEGVEIRRYLPVPTLISRKKRDFDNIDVHDMAIKHEYHR